MTFLPQSGIVVMAIKGLPYFNLDCWNCDQRSFLYSNLELSKCWSKVFSTPIWNCWNVNQRFSLLKSGLVEVLINGLLYFDMDLLKCRSKVFSTSIRTVEMLIKGLFYFDLDCWNGDQRSSLLQSEVVDMSIKGLLCFDLEFVEMLIQGFSTSIWSLLKCRSRASLLRSGVLPGKSQNLGARLLNYESFSIPLIW